MTPLAAPARPKPAGPEGKGARLLLAGAAAASLWYAAAVLLPWTGGAFRSLANPTAVLLAALGAALAVRPGWRKTAASAFELFDYLDARARRQAVRGLAGSFFILLASLKICQHFSGQTHGYDLGEYANICWNTLHGRLYFESYRRMSFLGDHFEPVLALFSLGFAVWNNAAVLLVIQSALLAAGLFPLTSLARRLTGRTSWAFAAAALYMFNPYLHKVSAAEFHPESLMIPLALWAFDLLERGRRGPALALAVLALGIKEDAALAVAGAGLYFGLSRRGPVTRSAGWALAAASLGWFLTAVLAVIPHFLGRVTSVHLERYASLGPSYGAIARNLALHPWRIATHLLWPEAKPLTAAKLLLTTAFLPLAAPLALLPAAAASGLHLLSDYPTQYNLAAQYSAMVLPFVFYAALLGLARLEARLWTRRAWVPPAVLLLCALGVFWSPKYLERFDWRRVQAARELIGWIPPGASVVAQQDLMAHVSLRENVNQYPERSLALPTEDYVLLDLKGNTWPLQPAQYEKAVRDLRDSGRYVLVEDKDGLELWTRR